MRCIGRTKWHTRCKNRTVFLFCRIHWIQPFAALLLAAGGVLTILQLGDLVRTKFLDVNPKDVQFHFMPTMSDTAHVWGDTLQDGMISIRVKMTIENNGHRAVRISTIGWCWFDGITECQMFQHLVGPFSSSEFSKVATMELPITVEPSQTSVLFARVVFILPWELYNSLYRGSDYALPNLEILAKLGEWDCSMSAFVVMDDEHQIIGTLPLKNLIQEMSLSQ